MPNNVRLYYRIQIKALRATNADKRNISRVEKLKNLYSDKKNKNYQNKFKNSRLCKVKSINRHRFPFCGKPNEKKCKKKDLNQLKRSKIT